MLQAISRPEKKAGIAKDFSFFFFFLAENVGLFKKAILCIREQKVVNQSL